MARYDELLDEVAKWHNTLTKDIKRFVGYANIKIPQMAEALREEKDHDGIGLSDQDIRERILKDCIAFWKRGTIMDAFPDWLVREYEKPENKKKESESENIQQQEPNQFTASDINIDFEEDKKFKSERIEKATLEIKRNFRMILKEATDKEDIQKIYNDYVYTDHALGNIKTAIEQIGRKYKATLSDPIHDKTKSLRKPISVYDLTFNVTEDKKQLIDEITDYVTLGQKQLDDFLNGLHRYPILTLEEYDLMRKSAKSWLIEIFNYVNNKSSQSIYDQLETDLLSEETTDPQAAKNTKALTLVCKTCIKKFDPEKNDDPPIMDLDRNSPSNFRCPTCLGIEMCERSLTKDIISQRKEFLKKVSSHITQAPPFQFLQIYSKAVKERITATRKTLMSKMLKDSSFGSSIEEFH